MAITQDVVSYQLKWLENDTQTRNETMINDISVLGLMLGCLLAKNFLWLGRKRVVLLANLMALISLSLCIYLNLWTIFIGKFIFGFSCGLNIVACSIYNKETLPCKTLSYMGTSVNTGIVLALTISTLVQNLTVSALTEDELNNTKAWRWPLAYVPMIMSITSSLLWLLVLRYDSIEFCLEKGNKDDAKNQLARVYRFYDPEQQEEDLDQLCQQIIEGQEKQKLEQADSPGYLEVFKNRKYRSCAIFCTISAIFNQLTGVNAVSFYSNSLFTDMGLDPLLGSYLCYIGSFAGSCCGPIANKCLSVKKLMTGGYFALFVWCSLITVFSITDLNNGVLVSIILFGFTYQLTCGSFQFVYFAQVSGESINSISTAALWTSTLLVNTLMPKLIGGLEASGTFGVFAICSLLGGLYSAFMQRETQGLCKEELRVLFYPADLKGSQQQNHDENTTLLEDENGERINYSELTKS